MRGAVLIVHSERRCREAARQALEHAGHAAAEAADLATAWRQAEALKPDLILLQWVARNAMRDAIDRVREAQVTGQARVLVWAHQAEIHAAVAALELGADDCLAIPFDQAELVARVNACLRRPATRPPSERVAAGPLVLDKAVHTVMVHDQRVELAPTEFRLMAFFLENPGRVFSREELLRRAWSRNIQAGQRTVDVHVRRLRQLLEPFSCDDMIQTVRGFGYRFAPPSREARVREAHVVEQPDVA